MLTDTSDRGKLITSFKHIRPEPEKQIPGGTYAYIKVFDVTKKDEDREVVAVGYAQMYFKDTEFNKQLGRKWALQYALGLNKTALRRQQDKGNKPQASIYSGEFSKEFRQAIWKSYWEGHRMGPLNKVARLQAKITELEAIISKTVECFTEKASG